DGRHLRHRDAVGDDPGGVVQAHRQARVPDGADPPPLRAQGLAGAARDRALLDHLAGARAGRPRDLAGAPMAVAWVTPFESPRQAVRLDAIGGGYDPWLLGVSIALACFGAVMVASSSIAIGEGLGVGPFHFLEEHLVFLGAGIVLAGWVMRTELKPVEQAGQWLLLACFVLLLLVFVPGIGVSVNGARRWLNFGLSNFQAVEAVKLLYIVWLA